MKNYNLKNKRIFIFSLLIILMLSYILFNKHIENLISNIYIKSHCYNELICYYVDVGQADCTIIKLPDDKIMIIDAGNIDTESESKFVNAFKKIFSSRSLIVDYLILTHSDNDHCGSMSYIFSMCEVKNFYRPALFLEDLEYYDKNIYNNYNVVDANDNLAYVQTIKSALNEDNLNIVINKAGIEIIGNEYSFEFLSPSENSYTKVNNYSPVILLNYKNRKFMFTGDILESGEREILKNYHKTKIDFLKVAHHGSKTSSCDDFIKNFTPNYAIISCGEKNNYGLPNSSTINTLLLNGIKKENILITRDVGSIIISVNSKGDILLAKTKKYLKGYIL